MIYNPAKYHTGSRVRIVNRPQLEQFLANWTLHHKLKPEQLKYAGKIARVKTTFMYHGGDVLYELRRIPGTWHEQCLEEAPHRGSLLAWLMRRE